MQEFTVWILDTDGWCPAVQTDRVMAQRIAKRYREIGIECVLEASAAVVLQTDGSTEQSNLTELGT